MGFKDYIETFVNWIFSLNFDFVTIIFMVLIMILIIVAWQISNTGILDNNIRWGIIKTFCIGSLLLIFLDLFPNYLHIFMSVICIYLIISSFRKVYNIEKMKDNKLKRNVFYMVFRFEKISIKTNLFVRSKFKLFRLTIPFFFLRSYVLSYLFSFISVLLIIFSKFNLISYGILGFVNLILCYSLWKNNIYFYSILSSYFLIGFILFGSNNILGILLLLLITVLFGVDKMDDIKLNYARSNSMDEYFTQ